MNYFKVIPVILLLLISHFLCAQITFQNTYNSNWDEEGHSVQETADGGYIIAGFNSAPSTDVYLIKTDSIGDVKWMKSYGGNSYDFGTAVQQTTDSGYIVAGYSDSFGAGQLDVYLIKTDLDGDTLWTKTYGGSDFEFGTSVQQSFDNGYIIAGWTQSFGAGSADVYLIKVDINGDTLWTKTYGGSSGEFGYSVQQTADSGFIIAGMTESFGAGDRDVLLIKTDVAGNILWSKTYGGTDRDVGNSVQQTSDGGYIVVGSSRSFGAGQFDVYLIKTDPNGDTLWTKTFGGSYDDEGYFVQQTSDGGYIITGYHFTADSCEQGSFAYLIKTTANGDTLWTKSFAGEIGAKGYSVKQIANGGYIVAGDNTIGSFGESSVYLIRTDSNGNTGCNLCPSGIVVGNPSTIVSSPALNTSFGGIVSNTATIVGNPVTFDSVLCDTVVSLREEIDNNFPQGTGQNYPNPFGTSTRIDYRVLESTEVSIKVYDQFGRLIAILVSEQKNPGDYSVHFDARDHSSGFYFYILRVGNTLRARKMVLAK
ncbi:MAG: T9SS type A sorting domain-containing protein [Bacteroidetes bacterium]|nr:T9SS type A sorting domain-containing protein [Bacteroidota bacterium]